MSQSKDIPLGRIIAEGIAIVVSILLAFAIDAWWQERSERVWEQGLVAGLIIEFKNAHSLLETLIEFHRSTASEIEELNELIDSSGEVNQSSRIIELSHSLWQVRLYSPQMPIYENLVNSIGLDAINNGALRNALHIYQSKAVAQKGWDEYLKAYDQDLMVATLASRLPYYLSVFPDSPTTEEYEVDVSALASDLELRNLIAIRFSGERNLADLRLDVLQAVEDVQNALTSAQ